MLGRAGLDATIRDGIDRIRLVQVSDFKVGTVASSQRSCPATATSRSRASSHLSTPATGVFDLELIGDAIAAEGYDAAVPRAWTARSTHVGA